MLANRSDQVALKVTDPEIDCFAQRLLQGRGTRLRHQHTRLGILGREILDCDDDPVSGDHLEIQTAAGLWLVVIAPCSNGKPVFSIGQGGFADIQGGVILLENPGTAWYMQGNAGIGTFDNDEAFHTCQAEWRARLCKAEIEGVRASNPGNSGVGSELRRNEPWEEAEKSDKQSEKVDSAVNRRGCGTSHFAENGHFIVY